MVKGFSFIELIIAIGIVVILSGGAIYYYPSLVENAKENTLAGNLNTLRKVIDDYYKDFGAYPQTLRTLTEQTPGGYVYLRKIPNDPTTGAPDWEVSENNIDFYKMDETLSYSFVRYVRSSNSDYYSY